MKCEDVFTFVCICMVHIAGAISFSIGNPIYPSEVGILYLVGRPGWGPFLTVDKTFMLYH